MTVHDAETRKLDKLIRKYLKSNKAEAELSGVYLLKVRIAKNLVLEFPMLAHTNHRYELLVAVNDRFNDAKTIILNDEQDRRRAKKLSKQLDQMYRDSDERRRKWLVKIGILPDRLLVNGAAPMAT